MRNSGYFVSYVDGVSTSYACAFLASAHARFSKELELDRELTNKRQF